MSPWRRVQRVGRLTKSTKRRDSGWGEEKHNSTIVDSSVKHARNRQEMRRQEMLYASKKQLA